MTVVNILKNGAVIYDMSKVTVPNEIVKNVYEIKNMKAEVKNSEAEKINS